MSSELLHEAAVAKILKASVTRESLEAMASIGAESDADNVTITLSYLGDDEEVSADYVPELMIRIKKVC